MSVTVGIVVVGVMIVINIDTRKCVFDRKQMWRDIGLTKPDHKNVDRASLTSQKRKLHKSRINTYMRFE